MKVKVTKVEVDTTALYAILESDEAQDYIERKAESILAMQQRLVPVETGNLKAHLQIQKTSDGLGREIGVFDRIPLIPADYAIYVEEGHEARDGSWVPAQPFIKPSVDAARD